MKTITFYSYKGGVGRSLTLSNIATRLADLGKRVCIMDFDLAAPGLHIKFDKYLVSEDIRKGMVDFLFDFQEDAFLPETINEYKVDVNYVAELNGKIDLIPAGNVNSNKYWQKLSSLNWRALFYSENNYGVKLLLHLKELINKELKPDFLLIDSRTGITDISGIAMTLLSDTVVTLAANNDENILGTARIIKSLKENDNILIEKQPEIFFVLTRIPHFDDPEKKYIEQRLINQAYSKINKEKELIEKVYVIHSDRELEQKEAFKINQIISSGNNKTKDFIQTSEDYLNLFEALTKDDLKEDEIDRFNNLKESQLLIDDAIIAKDNAEKIKLLKKAIKLNDNSDYAYFLLASTYIDIDSPFKALESINKAIDLDDKVLHNYYVKALIFDMIDDDKEAIKILKEVLKKDQYHYESLSLLGLIYYKQEKFSKALELQIILAETFNDADAYNSIANTYRALGDFDNAFFYVYKCLELEPKHIYGTGTLAEIYSELGNENEFYKNLRLSFVFGMSTRSFQYIINTEKIYKKYYKDYKFLNLLKNYNLKVNLPSSNKS